VRASPNFEMIPMHNFSHFWYIRTYSFTVFVDEISDTVITCAAFGSTLYPANHINHPKKVNAPRPIVNRPEANNLADDSKSSDQKTILTKNISRSYLISTSIFSPVENHRVLISADVSVPDPAFHVHFSPFSMATFL